MSRRVLCGMTWDNVLSFVFLGEVLMKNLLVRPGSLLSPRAGVSRLGALMSGRQRMVVRSASAALAMAACAGLAGCGVPSVADDAGSPAPAPSPTVTASPSPTPTPSPSPSPSPTPSPAPSPTQSPTPAPLPIPTTQAPTPEPPAPPATQEPESTPEEETEAGGGAAAPAPVPEPKQGIWRWFLCGADGSRTPGRCCGSGNGPVDARCLERCRRKSHPPAPCASFATSRRCERSTSIWNGRRGCG